MLTDPNAEFAIARFEASNVAPARFDHAAHICVAWLYIKAWPRFRALNSDLLDALPRARAA